ncbi:MAG TPA: hypothetical protein VH302_14245 [Bryobacteraceae bacterium]|jgi:hypothetical protein|nr:hypothetical protein [Bryobacteraceae bacterium]
MEKTQIDSATLLLAMLAGGLALVLLPGPLVWMSSIGGLILLFVLFSFDQEGYRTPVQSLAFGGVCGFSAAIAVAGVYHFLADNGEVHLANGRWQSVYVPLTAVFGTAIFWAIDLMRMNARKVGPIQVPRVFADTSVPRGIATPVAPPVSYQPASYPAPAPQPLPVRQSFVPPAAAEPAPVQTPPARPVPAPVQRPPVPEPLSQPLEVSTATSLFSIPPPPAEPTPFHPGPQPIISQSGKEVEIYVSLLGEGLNLMRSVRAEPLGRDFYRILEEMPEGETWQFGPGQVVKCKKKSLSTGKAMVAMEEAPRAT